LITSPKFEIHALIWLDKQDENCNEDQIVTGDAGSIGSNLLGYAIARRPSWKIINLDALTYAGNPMNLKDVGKPGETNNIGGNSGMQNIDVVHRLCDLMDSKLNLPLSESSYNLIRFVTVRPGHDRRNAMDASKIKIELDWSLNIDLRRPWKPLLIGI
jgi:dTDP-D-glucose 4,6-dehydratase